MSKAKPAYLELLGELETLAKAMSDNKEADKKIQAAADAGGVEGHEEPDGDEDEDEDKEGDGDGDEPMGKSFTAVIDGKEVEAVDGTALVKSLMAKVDGNETVMAKALSTTVDMLKSLRDEVQFLKSEVARVGGQGAGRKSTLNIHEKPAPAGSNPQPQVTAGEIMAKANSAAEAGRITWREVASIDASIRMGQTPDSGLLSRIVQ